MRVPQWDLLYNEAESKPRDATKKQGRGLSLSAASPSRVVVEFAEGNLSFETGDDLLLKRDKLLVRCSHVVRSGISNDVRALASVLHVGCHSRRSCAV